MPERNSHAVELYRALSGPGAMPVPPGNRYYVPILEETPAKDPILRLRRHIQLAQSESVDLLTGFRGNGKTTQLLRLRADLEKSGCHVFMLDMLDHVLMTKPIELSDFVLSLMSALARVASEDSGLDLTARSYGRRLLDFLKSEVEVDGLEFGDETLVATKLSLKLKTEATFKEQVQERLRHRLTRLFEEARGFVSELVDAVRKRADDPNKHVVLLVDSLEQLRGVGSESQRMHESVVALFSGEAANLRWPKLHVVYTVPPYLLPLAANVGRNFGGHPVTVWPNIHVRTKTGEPDDRGVAIVQQIIEQRYSAWTGVLSPEQLQRLAVSSGGDIRDLFRLVRETALTLDIVQERNPKAKVTDDMLRDAEQQLRNELMPTSEQDMRWLEEIHRTRSVALPSDAELAALARFFDSNLVMNYQNGEPWYDVHPLLVSAIERRVAKGDEARGS